MMERVLFSDYAPWVAITFAVLCGASAASVRSKKRPRNMLAAVAVLGFLMALAMRYGPYFYAAGGSEDTVAMALEDGALVVADKRTIDELFVDPDRDSIDDDVLRLHVVDPASGTVMCRAIVGLQARLLDVVDGQAWVAAAGFGSEVQWSHRSIRRMSVRDCSVEEVLEPGWRNAVASGHLGIKEIDYVGPGALLIAANDGSLHHLDLATRAQREIEPAEAEALRQEDPRVSRSGGEGSMGPFRTLPSGGGANFLRIECATEKEGRVASERVYVEPSFLARSSAQQLTLVAHREAERSPWILSALDDEGAHVWDLSEAEALGRARAHTPAGSTPFAVADAAGFIVGSHGDVVKVGWDGGVLWRLRL